MIITVLAIMGWDNPPVPWRELERRLSWGTTGGARGDDGEPDPPPRPVTRLPVPAPGPRWAELHCHSSYSFLDGASSPAELVAEAARRGLEALAITDHDGMYGVPQFAQAAAKLAEQTGIELGTVFGAELSVGLREHSAAGGTSPDPRWPWNPPIACGHVHSSRDLGRADPRTGIPDPGGQHVLVLARDPAGYRRLCRVISSAQLAGGEKGRPVYDINELARAHDGHWVILTGCRKGAVRAALAAAGPEAARRELQQLREAFGRDNVIIELASHDLPDDDEHNDILYQLAEATGTEVVATSNVHYAAPGDARLAQALAAVRARRSLDEMDGWLAASGAAYIRSGAEMAHRLRHYPG